MFVSIFLSYLPYALVTSLTPGPNNILSLQTIRQKGWRRGKDTLFGIFVGFLCVMILCALFCYELNARLPMLSRWLKYVGAAYILWLAVHVARSKPAREAGESRQASFWRGACLQLVNVKIILYAITVYTAYVLPAGGNLTFHPLALTAVGALGCCLWGGVGGLLQGFLAKYDRPFNYAMGAVLVLCAVSILK